MKSPHSTYPGVIDDWTWRVVAQIEETLLHRWFLPVCFAIFMALRAALIALVPIEQTSDFSWYLSRAIDISNGRGYSEGGVPTAYWPVGWPAVIALLFRVFGTNVNVVLIANLFFAAATFFVALDLGRRMFGSEGGARMGVLLLTIYPNNIAYTSLTGSETFYTLLLLLATWLYITRRSLRAVILCGVIFGYATLTKPQTLLMPAILIGISFFFEPEHRLKLRTLTRGVILYLAMALVLAPWIYRNYLVFGEPVFVSTNSGWAFYVGNNPSVLANRGFPTDSGPEVAKLREQTFTIATQLEANRAARAAALDWIRQNPGTFMLLMPIKAFTLWAIDGEAEWSYEKGSPIFKDFAAQIRAVRIVNQIFYILLIAGFLLGGWRIFRSYMQNYFGAASMPGVPVWSLTGYAFAAYTTLQCMIMAASYRYKFPLMPFVALAVGWIAFTEIANKAASRLAVPKNE